MPRVVNVVVKVVATAAGILLLPSFLFAQATIAGVIRDASAAVLPGVSVEAASPVLIEKARTVVSDGTGQYRITDLPPGSYVLTFTLDGLHHGETRGPRVSGSGVDHGERRPAGRRRGGNRHRVGGIARRRHAVRAPGGRAEQRNAEHAAGDARLRFGAGHRPGAEHRRRGGRGRDDRAHDAEHDVLHRARRRQRRRTDPDQRHGGRRAVRRRRRVGRHVRHRQFGRDAGADFRRPRRSRNRRAEHQHRAQVGRQPVPRLGVLQHVGRLGDVEQRRRSDARLRDHAAARPAHRTGT